MATLGVNMVMELTFEHVPTGMSVSFPAFLENLSDQFENNWNAEQVYGRMDPITTFMNTRRAISVSWNVPADSYDHAKSNLKKLNKLMSFLYPLYSNNGGAAGATAINQGPLVRISFGNLIKSATSAKGLLGYLNGFTFDPRLENGLFHGTPQGKAAGNVNMEYYPKTMLLNCELNVLHEHELGFKKVGNSYQFRNSKLGTNPKNNGKFPYFASDVSKNAERRGRIIEVVGPDGVTRLNRISPPATAVKKDRISLTRANIDAANQQSVDRALARVNSFGPGGPPGSKPKGIK